SFDLPPEHHRARPPHRLVARPLDGRHRVVLDLAEALAAKELRRALGGRDGEDVAEPARPRLLHEPSHEAVADPLALEARDRVQADDLAGALARVRADAERSDARELIAADPRSEPVQQQLADLLGRARLEKAFLLAALDEALDLVEVVDAEAIDAAVGAAREQRAGALVGEELASEPGDRAQVHGPDAARQHAVDLGEKRAAAAQALELGLTRRQQDVEHRLVEERDRPPAAALEEPSRGIDDDELVDAEPLGEARRRAERGALAHDDGEGAKAHHLPDRPDRALDVGRSPGDGVGTALRPARGPPRARRREADPAPPGGAFLGPH